MLPNVQKSDDGAHVLAMNFRRKAFLLTLYCEVCEFNVAERSLYYIVFRACFKYSAHKAFFRWRNV